MNILLRYNMYYMYKNITLLFLDGVDGARRNAVSVPVKGEPTVRRKERRDSRPNRSDVNAS